LRVFHTAAWLILLAHAQTNIPPVQQQQMQQFSAMQNNMMALIEQQRQQSEMILELFKMTNNN
jgi:chaperonin cofactor prefoldin